MTMMRIRGVWTANLAAFLLGAGMYASFILLPQFAQLPRSTGFGFGASVVVSGLYLLPSTSAWALLGSFAGRIERRFGSRRALLAGTALTAAPSAARVRAQPPLRHAGQLHAARDRDRPGLRGARQPDRAGRPAAPDRRRQRHEHGACARSAARWAGSSRRRSSPPTPPTACPTVTWLHRDLPDGNRLSARSAWWPASLSPSSLAHARERISPTTSSSAGAPAAEGAAG